VCAESLSEYLVVQEETNMYQISRTEQPRWDWTQWWRSRYPL